MIALPLPEPPLAGTRYGLRLWTPEDASALAAAWADPEVRRRMPVPDPANEAAAADWIGGCAGRRTAGLALDLAVVDLSEPDRAVVHGEVGLSAVDRDRGTARIGWWTAPDHRRRGVATEAVSLLAQWALGPLGLEALVAEVDHDNAGSLAVARTAGFEDLGRPVDGRTVLMARPPGVVEGGTTGRV